MDGRPRKIEIFEPFGAAFELTKRILFQPFDLRKWFVIGFAAFLAGLSDGTRIGFPTSFGGGDYEGDARMKGLSAAQEELMSWITTGVIAVVVLVVVVMILLSMWLGSRGRFMFVDCIVRNRGAIQEPWREFRREANSLFLFSLASMLASFLITALLALPFIIPYLRTGEFGDFGTGYVIYLVVSAGLFMLIAIAWSVAVWFVVPVMYRRRCSAWAALLEVAALVAANPVPFILYVLFTLVLLMAGGIASCVLMCATCCIAAIPYVGTVVLLPLYTFYYAFTLLFLRQFGPEYDVWANSAEHRAAVEMPPVEPPPLQA